MSVAQKQRSTHEDWLVAIEALRHDPTVEARAHALVEGAAHAVAARARTVGRRLAYAWSGGKDSLALELVAEAAGIGQGVLVISDLEYPAFLGWATDNMPHGLSVEVRPWDLHWLAAHEEMLFPATSALATRWFAGVQHWGQRRYCERRDVDVLLLGRRRADGNYVGAAGADLYRDKAGFIRWSPLAHWTNEDVLTALVGYGVSLPPCYGWPRGFRVGTGSWAARQWCPSPADGWREVASIDVTVVERAAALLPGARACLEGL